MEKKGYLESKEGEANSKRGGKPKRCFFITAYGKSALEYYKDVRLDLWNAMPDVVLDLNK